jgi:hypothetical protein
VPVGGEGKLKSLLDRDLIKGNILEVVSNFRERIETLERLVWGEGGDSALAAGQSVAEGPDIDLVYNSPGTAIIGRGGDSILLFDSGGQPVAEYAATSAGFAAALAAATSGDTIYIPSATISGNHTIALGVEVVGESNYNSVLSGIITNNGIMSGIRVSGTLTNNGALHYVIDPAGATQTTKELGMNITPRAEIHIDQAASASIFRASSPSNQDSTLQLYTRSGSSYNGWAMLKERTTEDLLINKDNVESTPAATVMKIDQVTNLTSISIDSDLAPDDIYIATTGSDTTGDGTAGTPYETLAKALAMLPNVLAKAHTIHVADGTYAEAIDIQNRVSVTSAGWLKITGNTTAPANVVFTGTCSITVRSESACAAIGGNIFAELEGIKINATVDYGIIAHSGAHVDFDRIIIAGTTTMGLILWRFADCRFHGNITISGFSGWGIHVLMKSLLSYWTAGTLTITGPTGSAWGMSVGYGSAFHVEAIAVSIVITAVKYGIHASLSSVWQHYFGSGTITIDNASTPSGSIAIWCNDVSTFSTNHNVTIDNFTTCYWSASEAYVEVSGINTVTNYTNLYQLFQNSVIVDGATLITYAGSEQVRELIETAAPGTPPTDHGYLYEKSDGKIYFKNDAGTEYDLTVIAGGIALNDLSDVDTTGVGTGDIIYKSAGDWVDYPLGVGTKIVSTSGKIDMGDNAGGDYVEIDTTTGSLRLVGNATAWDDLRIEPNVRQAAGVGVPAFEKYFDDAPGTSRGVFLYSFTDEAVAGNEKEVFFSMQMPHNWKVGSDISMHVHFVPAATVNSSDIIWGLEYTWKAIGQVFGDTVIVYSSTTLMPDDANITAGKHYIAEFTDLAPGATASGLSSILIGRLFRHSSNASDTYTDKVGLLYIDAHYQVDSFGSDEEYIKDTQAALLMETGDYLLLETGDYILTE